MKKATENHTLQAQVTSTLCAMLNECVKEKLSFQNICLGIEVLLKQLAERQIFCTGFNLVFDEKAIGFEALSVTNEPADAADYEGFWKIVFMVCAPKTAPNVKDTLVVRKATFQNHQMPTVQYMVKVQNDAQNAE